MTQGHLLIPLRETQYVTPAAFVGNGLAIHRSLFKDGYTITHVRSGCALRHSLTRPHAYRVARALAAEDWTFDQSATTHAHAERVRVVCGF